MKCKVCRSKDVQVFLRSYGLALCKKDFIHFFENRIKKAIEKFRMFSFDEHVTVAISGGKDSLALLHVLNRLGYKVEGYFLNLGIAGFSDIAQEKVVSFCKQFGIPVNIESLKEIFGYNLLEISRVMKRPACAFCGIIKRYFMNRFALGSVLATGHTMYDEATVLLANMLQWKLDYLERQYPMLQEREGFCRKVKPLVFVSEKETAIYCFFNNIDYLNEFCPLSQGAKSRIYKYQLLHIEASVPGTIIRFLKGFYSVKKKLNFSLANSFSIERCKLCGYPTSADGVCVVCRIKQKLEGLASS